MTPPPDLNPGLLDLLALRFDPLVWLPVLAVTGLYFWHFLRARRNPEGRRSWPAWKAVLFGLGMALLILVTQSAATTLTLNSMALYMGRLMVLAEIVPPLLVLGLPRVHIDPRRPLGRVLGVLLDPWVALAVWTAVIVFWNVPAGFNASVVTNTASALLPALYLLSSLLVWGVVLRPLPSVQPAGIGSRGWFGFIAALPMMAVAAVWLYSRQVLYTPYVSALCLWDLTPLQNQQISGLIMMLAGLPALALALVQLMAWLIQLADSGTQPPAARG
ncbi:cytochrome c oxidase assembly protein [Deinococcus budaensis]|uniref:Cytochrome c oxidase assembly factor CtaG n=1 Tax=Deinococcus budaensis TaxID=1665626 RepID=A0A7W8GGI9_9DEIO|nr:cytochrome c oxidase assembly protein [Deinococcus budaensis]MBB5235262.1 cytochrome c oxidase assembly factor CtaG [Deinococcus budaensis]